MEPTPLELSTERLSLRLRTRADAGWNVALLLEHEPPQTRPLAAARRRLVRQNAEARRTGIGFLAIRRHAEGDVIGYTGLYGDPAEPMIAYELFRRAHGHGYATEAARALLDAAWATGRQRVWATIWDWNAASLSVAHKLGFSRHRAVREARGTNLHLVAERPAG